MQFLRLVISCRYGVDPSRCAKWLQTMKAVNTQMGNKCPSHRQLVCERNAPYRTIDGSCNHLTKPAWGKSFSAYRRLIPAQYDDGKCLPKFQLVCLVSFFTMPVYFVVGVTLPRGTHRNKLPNSRLVSSSLASDHDLPDDTLTLAMMQWTQFVEHDLVHTPTAKMGKCLLIQSRVALPLETSCLHHGFPL